MEATEQPQLLGLDVPELASRRRQQNSLTVRQPNTLTVRQLATWASRQLANISRITGVSRHSEIFTLSQAVKLSEEVGELHAEILGHLKMQRTDKNQNFNTESLAGELADVIMSAAVLSQALGIDLTDALHTKMATVDTRMATLNTTRRSG
ncbi:MazG nucleotide pyrophosphohydrolase domain-containing protein [Mycobacterium sp. D16R24]|uniref:MazG nucleotide pyrophosphohydrolase domain-containing protein n=1 Tax=Mycobacterium sp. D16R24 TaxID=1855656 RepID=UPI0009935E0E|nr:MazG nucleotide pyrophosphohydrolase domain-containing protein [Mycobacterium sp. D16R24]